jgi:hypothetical protein
VNTSKTRTALVLFLAGLTALWFAGCDGTDDDDSTVTDDDDDGDDDDVTAGDDDDSGGPIDEDGDGAVFGEDCNDGDASLNLADEDGDGATTCDGDCDDGDPALNLDDADSDGATTCDQDCDDEDPANSPLFAEACDGVDNDCDGEPEAALDGACGLLWILEEGSSTFTTQDMIAPGDAHAPTGVIEAAFAVEEAGKIWVVTYTTYNVMDMNTLAWIDSGDRDTIFGLDPVHSVFAMTSTPSWYTGESGATIALYVTGNRHTYAYDLDTDDITLLTSEGYDGAWDNYWAPAHTHIRAAWLDTENARGWAAEGNPADICGAPSTQMAAYLAVMSLDGVVHLYDDEWCNDFVAVPAGSDFGFFTYANAPGPTDVEAIAWTGTDLIIFDY